MEIQKLKDQLNERVKPHSPCSGEYKRFLRASNEAELLKVISDNLLWCLSNKVLSHEYFSQFNQEAYLKSGISNTGLENTGFSNSGNRNSGDSNSGNRNSGNRNSGDSNSGYRNSGDRNSGDSNSGNSNSGNWNSGDSNSGNRNSGDSNSGNRNSGNSNSGNWNSGNRNSGNSNSGNWNSGNRNSGDSNSGYRNSGAFCTDTNPKLVLFDVLTDITIKEWESHPACLAMSAIDPTIWVPSNIMTDEEKANHPKYETTEGYLKTIPMKEAWSNAWNNFTDDTKAHFTTLPHFDAVKFESITGIKVSK